MEHAASPAEVGSEPEDLRDVESARARAIAAADGFSLVRGDPLDRLWCALGLGGASRARLRAAVLAALCWIPAFVFATAEGHLRSPVHASFLADTAVHLRCLVSLPLLVLAEIPVDAAFRDATRRFAHHQLIPPDQLRAFARALERTERLKRSLAPTLVLLGIVALRSVSEARALFAASAPSWIAPHPALHALSLAGFWHLAVSLPLFGLMLLTWAWRWCLWVGLLASVARLRLQLLGSHPDRLGSLGFLEHCAGTFGVIAFASAAAVSGTWIHRVLHEGASIRSLWLPLAALVAGVFVVTLGPLLLFAPKLYWLKHEEVQRFDELSQSYDRAFERAWLDERSPRGDELLRRLDAQTFTDLNTAAERVHAIRVLPFSREVALRLLLSTLVPMAPLVLTVVPAREIATKLLDALM